MLYGCLLLYVGLIYIRPAEIVAEWATFPFVDTLSVVAAIVAVFSIAGKPRPVFNLPQDKLLLAMWLWIPIATVRVWTYLAYMAWLDFLPAVFGYFLLRAAVSTERHVKGLIYLLIGLNVFLAVNGIVQYHTVIGLGDVTLKDGRIYGTGIFNDPNDLGMSFVMAIPFVFWMIGNHSRLIVRALGVITLITIGLAIYYTNSRGTIIGLGAALICYSFQKFSKGGAIAVAIALTLLIAIAAPSRAGQMDFGESSAQGRIQAWSEGLTMFKMNPILGVGYGQYTEHYEQVAHNSFVHTLAELGFFGAFCFTGMFFWFFKGLARLHDLTPSQAAWRNAMVSSGVGVLATIWFLSRQYVVILYVLLALGSCGSLLLMRSEQNTTPMTISLKETVQIVGLTVVTIVIVYISIRTMAIWS